MLLGAGWAAALTALWMHALAPHLPPDLEPPRREPAERIWHEWLRLPVFAFGDLSRADIAVLGDSRALAGVDLPTLRRARLGRPAILCRGGVELLELIQVVKLYPAPRIVLTLSPLSLYNGDQPTAPQRPPQPPNWRQRLDRRLDSAVGRALDRSLRMVNTADWEHGWFARPRPNASTGSYSRTLARDRPERNQAVGKLASELRQLQQSGRLVACVRLPVSPQMRAAEDTFFRAAAFDELCLRTGVPYLDLSELRVATRDGSHLTYPEALDTTGRIAAWLESLPGWSLPAR